MPNQPKSTRQTVLNAALLVAALFMVSRLLGFVRQALFAYYFGTDPLNADAYNIVSPIPELIYDVIAGGALSSAFIPVFTGYFKREGQAGADDQTAGWELFATTLNLVIIIATLFSLLTALVAPSYLRFFFAEKLAETPGLLAVAVPLLRVMLISPIIFGITGVVMAALHSRQHFLTPALAAVLFNVGIIIGLVAWPGNIMGIGYGTVLGAILHVGVQLPALRQVGGRYQPRIRITAAVRRVLWLMAPRMLGLSFSHLNRLVTPFIAQPLAAGSISALPYANRIMLLPHGILGMALGVASFPTFADLAAKDDLVGMRAILADTMRLILFLGMPIMVGMIMLRRPLIAAAFERGGFDAADTEFVAWGLLFYALALVALAWLEIIVRAFYALQDTMTPVIVGGLQMALMLGLGLWLGRTLFPSVGWLGLGGVALAYSIANWAEVLILMALLRRRLNGIGGTRLLDGLWRMAIASAGMGVVLWAIVARFPAEGFTQSLMLLLGGTAVGALVYAMLCRLLGLAELDLILRKLKRRG